MPLVYSLRCRSSLVAYEWFSAAFFCIYTIPGLLSYAETIFLAELHVDRCARATWP